jgi:hypothetical protein
MAESVQIHLPHGVNVGGLLVSDFSQCSTVRLKPPFDDAQGGPEALEGPNTTYVNFRCVFCVSVARDRVCRSRR